MALIINREGDAWWEKWDLAFNCCVCWRCFPGLMYSLAGVGQLPKHLIYLDVFVSCLEWCISLIVLCSRSLTETFHFSYRTTSTPVVTVGTLTQLEHMFSTFARCVFFCRIRLLCCFFMSMSLSVCGALSLLPRENLIIHMATWKWKFVLHAGDISHPLSTFSKTDSLEKSGDQCRKARLWSCLMRWMKGNKSEPHYTSSGAQRGQSFCSYCNECNREHRGRVY